MKRSFKAIIYKTGINLCVDVPKRITVKMNPLKGYIPIKGTINGYGFMQTLVPLKNAPYRLFVNGPMLKGAGIKPGDTVPFSIEQDFEPREENFPAVFKKALTANGLLAEFNQLTPARKKEVLRYLNHLKTKESLQKNIEKVITQLQQKRSDSKGFLRVLHPKK
ncbi:MAG: YdeI/OmpD-associated family protein [Chitinophagaceae bacterium]